MEISDYVAILRRRWRTVVVAVLIAAAAGWVSAPGDSQRNKFEGTALLAVSAVNPVQELVTLDPLSAEIVSSLAGAGDVPQRAAARLNEPNNADLLAARIRVKADTKTEVVQLTATDELPDRASSIANAFAAELAGVVSEREQQQLKEARDAINQRIATLDSQLASLETRIAANPTGSQALQAERNNLTRTATIERGRIQELDALQGWSRLTLLRDAVAVPVVDDGFAPPRSKLARAGIGVLLGLLLGCWGAVLTDRLDTRIRTKEEAEKAFHLPVVAEVPKATRWGNAQRILALDEPASAIAEAYRSLRTSLSIMPLVRPLFGSEAGNGAAADPGAPPVPGADDGRQVVVVTSSGPGEGKTATVANLAVAFAETGQDVLVVSADIRRPTLHKFFGLSEGPGLTEYMSGRTSSSLQELAVPTGVNGVRLIHSGGPVLNPGRVVSGERDLLPQLRALADVVIVDTPPLLVTNDASELMAGSDAVVLVCRAGRTTAAAASRTAERVARLGAPVIGVALIGSTTIPYAYGRYYRYYQRDVGQAVDRPEGLPPTPGGRTDAPAARSGSARLDAGSGGGRSMNSGNPAASRARGRFLRSPSD